MFVAQPLTCLGKTVLASSIIEACTKIPSVSTVYFYCKHLDDQRNTFIALARAVLVQLVGQNKDLTSYLYEKHLESGSISLASAQLSKDLLDTALRSLTKIYVIIDGLDECQRNERKSILSFFTSIIENTQPGSMRGMFVSQDEDDIRQLLQRASLVRLTEDHNRQDIQTFAAWWADRIQQKFDLSQEHGWYIVNVVCDGAEGWYDFLDALGIMLTRQGMFLFARLVLTNLYDQTSRAELFDELRPARFPHGLDQA